MGNPGCSFNASWTHVRRRLFLSPGLTRVYSPDRRRGRGNGIILLSETDGSKAYRRNTLALASVLVVAGFAGADPRDLSVFGVKPDGDWGVIVISAAAIVTQLYWYVSRCLHMEADAVIEQDDSTGVQTSQLLKIRFNDSFVLERKSGDLFSNWSCFLLTVISWYFAISWVVDASFE